MRSYQAIGFFAIILLHSVKTEGRGLKAEAKQLTCRQDKKCRMLGGQCKTSFDWDPNVCGKSIASQQLCGLSDSCVCCLPEPDCEQTKKCDYFGGECMSKRQCLLKGDGYEPVGGLCKWNPFTEEPCYCCIKEEKKCEKTESCAAKDGQCITREECADLTNGQAKWDSELCDNPLNEIINSETCGCCYREVEPKCETTEECKSVGGSCESREQCNLKGGEWNPTLCSINGIPSDCGCCTLPNPPTCKDSRKCSANGGYCEDPNQACKPGYDDTYDEGFCLDLSGGPSTNCKCCLPKQECEDTRCNAVFGKCVEYKSTENTCTSGILDPSLCIGDDCACCRPLIASCIDTDEKCSGLSDSIGCMQNEAECKKQGGTYADYNYCEGKDCFCCRKPDTKPCHDKEYKCASQPDALSCMTDKDQCKLAGGTVFNYDLCGDGEDCFCCQGLEIPKECEDPEDKCKNTPNSLGCTNSVRACKEKGGTNGDFGLCEGPNCFCCLEQ